MIDNMENTKEKNILENRSAMPHNGTLLRQYIDEKARSQSQVAEQMGITLSTLQSYYKRETMHTKALWNASLALEHNFLFDLGRRLPVSFVSEREQELQRELDELKKENERLKIELGVYEKIVKR